MPELKKITVKIPEDTYSIIENMAKKEDATFSETVRKLLYKAINIEWAKENEDMLAAMIRQQMDIVIKPHVERLAKISSKSGHIGAAAAFLNVQALMDLVPVERRKDVRAMFESAKKKAVEYMKTPVQDWEGLDK